MTNTSATGGYLIPASAAPLSDADLEDVFQNAVAQVTGLPGRHVVPRWQTTPPPQPEPTVDWCAIGVQSVGVEATPAIIHVPTGDGADELQQFEQIELLASFYGPHGLGMASLFRDGMGIPQNSEAIRAATGLAFVSSEPITPAPALYNQTWIRKYDLRLTYRRMISRTYPVLNLLSVVGVIHDGVAPAQSFEVES